MMQISVMQQRAFTRAAILAVLVALATTQQCDYQVNDNNVINVPVSEKNGVVFMSDVYKPTREECQSACCDMEEEELDDGSYVKCNLAVFHHSGKPRKANCFLIYCPSEGSCVFSEVREFSSSFVTYTLKPEESTQSSTLFSDDDVNSPTIASEVTPSPKLTSPSKSTPSIPPTIPEPAKTSPSSIDDPLRKELEVNQTLAGNTTSAALGGNETTAPLANEIAGVGNETAAAAEIDTLEGEEDTATNSLIASNGALIAAVCFGVLFLMAVLVVIGKHWYEAYQRRHYSKVDYLINGMYN